ncbi:MAG TPA: PQQ-dependent sugar dehydrogenase [Kofleriaceae bacterium]|nr:PQQ-dependent sugar dehydrogenase [Kofleriaceae bacterium]
MAVAAPLAAACGGGSSPPTTPGASCGDADGVWASDTHYCVSVWAQGLGNPRQMAFAPNGDLFVSNGSLTVLHDDDGNGTISDGERTRFATASGLNHGIAFSRDFAFVYASSATTVYRWAYSPGARQSSGAAQVVVANLPTGGHESRTLAFDSKGRLYVSVGSASNVDPASLASTRALIRRFTIPDALPGGGLDYASGETFASGMRNEVGLYVDARDRIWGVENGRDMLRSNGDIHNENPAEEVNLMDGAGSSFFGYPKCFSEFHRDGGMGPGTQWADVELSSAEIKTDAWCRDLAQVHPPRGAMPAHWAPLGIIEYQGSMFPWGHDLIVTAHGSWNSDKPVGRLLARLHRDGDNIASVEPIVGERGPDGALRQGQWDARPVDVREAADGALYFSDDMGGRIFKLTYAN